MVLSASCRGSVARLCISNLVYIVVSMSLSDAKLERLSGIMVVLDEARVDARWKPHMLIELCTNKLLENASGKWKLS